MKKKSVGDIVASTLGYILIVLLLGIVIYNVYSAHSTSKHNISIFGYRPVVVVSGSMLPSIQINSISIMKYCDINDVKIGDVIMYQKPDSDMKITHRVIAINHYSNGDEWLTVKGDNNKVADSADVTGNLVIGKLTKTYNWIAPYITQLSGADGTLNLAALVRAMIVLAIIVFVVLTILYNIVVELWYIIMALSGNSKYYELLNTSYDKSNRVHKVCDKYISNTDSAKHIGLVQRIKMMKQMKVFNDVANNIELSFGYTESTENKKENTENQKESTEKSETNEDEVTAENETSASEIETNTATENNITPEKTDEIDSENKSE